MPLFILEFLIVTENLKIGKDFINLKNFNLTEEELTTSKISADTR